MCGANAIDCVINRNSSTSASFKIRIDDINWMTTNLACEEKNDKNEEKNDKNEETN